MSLHLALGILYGRMGNNKLARQHLAFYLEKAKITNAKDKVKIDRLIQSAECNAICEGNCSNCPNLEMGWSYSLVFFRMSNRYTSAIIILLHIINCRQVVSFDTPCRQNFCGWSCVLRMCAPCCTSSTESHSYVNSRFIFWIKLHSFDSHSSCVFA